MADRRPEESPVAPRRTLAGPGSSTPDPRLQDTVASTPVRDEPTPSGGPAGPATAAGAAAADTRPGDPGSTAAGAGGGEPRRSGAQRVAAAVAAARGERPGDAGPRRTRKAHLRLAHVDPWSVMKTSFLLSIAVGIVMVVAVAVVWSVLGIAGVWESIDRAVGDVLGNEASDSFSIQDYLGMSRVLGFTMLVAVVDVVLLTVLATLAAFLYNLAAALLGGVEVTLAEDDRSAAGGR